MADTSFLFFDSSALTNACTASSGVEKPFCFTVAADAVSTETAKTVMNSKSGNSNQSNNALFVSWHFVRNII
jgi:hypothetical protein